MFVNLNSLIEPKNMVMGNGGILQITQEGDVGLKVKTEKGEIDGILHNMRFREVRVKLLQ